MSYAKGLSSDEEKAVEELRQSMKSELLPAVYEDKYLLYRFLRARNMDVGKAEIMLRKNLKWRKSFQIETILTDFKPKEFFVRYIQFSHIGVDIEGDIVEYTPWGKFHGRDIMKSVKANDYMKHFVWLQEHLITVMNQQLQKTGRKYSLITIIIDLDELTLANVTYRLTAEMCIRLLRLLSDNYPEYLKSVYVINAPSYYTIVFSLMKALMSNEMIQKIHIFGHDGWKLKLLEIIDADVLPAFLGGNRTDPDGNPLCKTFVTHGGRIPEKYHLTDEERWFKDKARVKKIAVHSKSKELICIDVTEGGSKIQWEFYLRGKDIGFGLFFKEREKLIEVLPIQIYDTMDGTEVGSYRTRSPGNYVIVFDNSNSWITSKEIEYCITVLKS